MPPARIPNYRYRAFATIKALAVSPDSRGHIAIRRDIIMRPVISIPRSATLDTFSPFLPLFRCEMKLRCIHTARFVSLSLPLFLFYYAPPLLSRSLFPSLSAPLFLLPLCSSEAECVRRSCLPSALSLRLFSDGFSSSSLPQTLEPHLASPFQLFLICYTAIPSPPSVLLPTGPHENTYFTGIHDGRRTSVQTCLLGCF